MTASKPFPVRLRPIIDHYLKELVKAGAYGKTQHAVMVRFIENGVVAALQGNVLKREHVADFPDATEAAADAGREAAIEED
jgi:hypothetical protein